MTKQEIIDKIIENYTIKNFGLVKSGKEFGLGQYAVKTILKESKIRIRTQAESAILANQQRRVNAIQDDYFHIESPNMAYILGILASDGTIRKKGNEVKLTLAEKDSELLYKIKEEIQYSGTIKHYQDSKGFENATLAFTSEQAKKDLAYYGIIPEKTFSLTFPIQIQKQYWIDFIRGYFDGDGSVGKTGEAIRWQVCSATKDILEKIITFFYEEYQIPKITICSQQRKNNPLYYIQYSTNSTKQIYKILYTPNSLYLKRKKEKFESII